MTDDRGHSLKLTKWTYSSLSTRNVTHSFIPDWFIYIIRCEDGSLYTGSTNHVIRRWHQHRSGKGAKYTRARKPDELIHVEGFSSRSAACKREYAIKQMTRPQKEKLIFND